MTGDSNVSNAWFVIAEGRASEWDRGVEAFPRLTRESRSSGACQLPSQASTVPAWLAGQQGEVQGQGKAPAASCSHACCECNCTCICVVLCDLMQVTVSASTETTLNIGWSRLQLDLPGETPAKTDDPSAFRLYLPLRV